MRYKLMNASKDFSLYINKHFKDTLSANYEGLEKVITSDQVELNKPDVERFDLFIFKNYGSMKYMDLVLEMNSIEHRTDLRTGDVILVPTKNNLDEFIKSRRKS